ncbi:MAG: hypothetical protein ACP5T6_01615 [Candidatus Micrarchaeia archaeon]
MSNFGKQGYKGELYTHQESKFINDCKKTIIKKLEKVPEYTKLRENFDKWFESSKESFKKDLFEKLINTIALLEPREIQLIFSNLNNPKIQKIKREDSGNGNISFSFNVKNYNVENYDPEDILSALIIVNYHARIDNIIKSWRIIIGPYMEVGGDISKVNTLFKENVNIERSNYTINPRDEEENEGEVKKEIENNKNNNDGAPFIY